MERHEEVMLKSLVAIAWADGRIADEEVEVVEAMLSRFRLGPEDAAMIREYAKTPKSLDDVPVAELAAADRAMLLRHAVILSHIDDGQADEEKTLIAAIVKKLGIDDAEAKALIAEAEAEARELLEP